MKIPEEWRDIARKRLFYGIAAVIGLVSFVAFLAIGGSMRVTCPFFEGHS